MTLSEQMRLAFFIRKKHLFVCSFVFCFVLFVCFFYSEIAYVYMACIHHKINMSTLAFQHAIGSCHCLSIFCCL